MDSLEAVDHDAVAVAFRAAIQVVLNEQKAQFVAIIRKVSERHYMHYHLGDSDDPTSQIKFHISEALTDLANEIERVDAGR
jgi:hypothetical protein